MLELIIKMWIIVGIFTLFSTGFAILYWSISIASLVYTYAWTLTEENLNSSSKEEL